MHIALWLVVVALIATNLIVCFRILRSGSYVISQKIGQMLMVWAVPLLGASVAWYFLKEETTQTHTTDLYDRTSNADEHLRFEASATRDAGSDGAGADGGGD